MGNMVDPNALIESLREFANHDYLKEDRENALSFAKVLMSQAAETLSALEYSVDDLSLYFVAFSRHEGREWTCHAGYVFAYNKETIEALLSARYGTEIKVRSAERIDIFEGSVLYGRSWTSC